jgi:3-oxoacyl-[acyl-carrier-protein] synthase II
LRFWQSKHYNKGVSRVFITGVGVVSSIGLGKRAFFEALVKGESGVKPVTTFDTTRLGRQYAGEVSDFVARDHLTHAESRRMGRCSAMALAASRMAVTDSGLNADKIRASGPRVAVVIGTTMGEADILEVLDYAWIERGPGAVKRALLPKYGSTLLPIHVARALGAQGMVLALPGACAAGNYAIGFAADLIRSGRADCVITGATEVILRTPRRYGL